MKLVEHLSFDNFKKNPSVNYASNESGFLNEGEEPFIRKGKYLNCTYELHI